MRSRRTGRSRVTGILLLAVAPLALVPWGAVANAAPNAAADKTDVCHWDDDTGTWARLSVSGRAVPAHLDHGDGVPGGSVPGPEGRTFDAGCTPVSPFHQWCQSIPGGHLPSVQAPGIYTCLGSVFQSGGGAACLAEPLYLYYVELAAAGRYSCYLRVEPAV